jgi:protease I
MLAEAGVAKGKQVTSWPSLRTDLTNAGANWRDEQVVVDNGLVTSRKPGDIPAFNQKMIEVFSGAAAGQNAISANGRRS